MSITSGPEPDDIAADMARLEAALDRIDHLAAKVPPGRSEIAPQPVTDPVSPVVRERLDSMIDRLRAAIDEA